MTGLMKTASLGLLEVLVVRANGGGCPPDPPSVGDVMGIHLTYFSSRKVLLRISEIFLVKNKGISQNSQDGWQ